MWINGELIYQEENGKVLVNNPTNAFENFLNNIFAKIKEEKAREDYRKHYEEALKELPSSELANQAEEDCLQSANEGEAKCAGLESESTDEL